MITPLPCHHVKQSKLCLHVGWETWVRCCYDFHGFQLTVCHIETVQSSPVSTFAPASSSFANAASRRWKALVLRQTTLPPDTAAATKKVPRFSIRSATTECYLPPRRSTPSIVIVSVPAPKSSRSLFKKSAVSKQSQARALSYLILLFLQLALLHDSNGGTHLLSITMCAPFRRPSTLAFT